MIRGCFGDGNVAYCEQTDLELRVDEELIEMWSGDDDDVVTQAIADADAEIDSLVGTRYAVPFASTPAFIKTISMDIAVYYLATRRGMAAERGGVDVLWVSRFRDAMRKLEEIRDGKRIIPDETPSTSIRTTEEDVQPAITYTKQDDSGEEIETDRSGDDLDNTLDEYLDPS